MKYNQYNVVNQIIRVYKKAFPDAKVYTRKYSSKYIEETLNNIKDYPIIEFSEMFYKSKQNKCNRLDVEGMGYGWIWYGFRKRFIKDIKSKHHRPKMIVVEGEDFRIIHFPTRGISQNRFPTNSDFAVCVGKSVDDVFMRLF